MKLFELRFLNSQKQHTGYIIIVDNGNPKHCCLFRIFRATISYFATILIENFKVLSMLLYFSKRYNIRQRCFANCCVFCTIAAKISNFATNVNRIFATKFSGSLQLRAASFQKCRHKFICHGLLLATLVVKNNYCKYIFVAKFFHCKITEFSLWKMGHVKTFMVTGSDSRKFWINACPQYYISNQD